MIALCRLFRKEKPTIVHTHTPKAGLLGMLAAKFVGVPVRMHTVAGLPLMEANGLNKTLLVLAERITYWSATMVYPNSRALYSYITNSFYKNKERLKVIGSGSSNGIDLNYFKVTESISNEAKKIRSNLLIGENDTVTVFVGRITKDKGINELVKVIGKLKNMHLLLVGAFEPHLDPLEEDTVKEIRSNPCVHHVGFQKDIRPYLSAADYLTFPSYREGFPNVPMQAGAMGLPTIATDINGCNEIIKHEENGLLISPKDEMSLKKAIERMQNDTVLYQSMKENARKTVADRFDQHKVWEAIAEEYKEQMKIHVS